MRKVSRTLSAVLLAAVLAAVPAAALHARPPEDTEGSARGVLDRLPGLLHDLMQALDLGRLWASNESSPSFDPNGTKAAARTPSPTDLEVRPATAGARQGTVERQGTKAPRAPRR